MESKIISISIYPVKALGGIDLNSSEVDERGLRNDRRFMLIDRNNKFFTQREYPILASVRTSIKGEVLEMSHREHGVAEFPLNPPEGWFSKRDVEVQVWQSAVAAHLAEDAVNDWFSGLLGIAAFAAYMPDSSRRSINANFDNGNEVVSFADGYPLLIVNQASLDELNSKMDAALPVNRFRPNVVVSGSKPFEEDGWKRIRIGNTAFRVTKPCARCTVTTVDQEVGIKAGVEPLKTLAKFRTATSVFPGRLEEFDLSANDVLFGTNLVPESTGGRIEVGDTLEVLD